MNENKRRIRKSAALSAAAIILMLLGCFYCRFVLGEWRQSANSIPTYLLAVGTAVSVIAFFCKGRYTQAFSAFGYIAGLFAGYFFNSDGTDPGGGRTNNMWIIWSIVFLGIVIIGIITDLLKFRTANIHEKSGEL